MESYSTTQRDPHHHKFLSPYFYAGGKYENENMRLSLQNLQRTK